MLHSKLKVHATNLCGLLKDLGATSPAGAGSLEIKNNLYNQTRLPQHQYQARTFVIFGEINSITTVFDFIQKPFGQLVSFLSLTLAILIIFRPKNADTVWTMAGLLYVGFIIANTIFMWKAENTWTYFFISVGFSILYILVVAGTTSIYEKLVDMEGSGESGMIFLVVIYHPFTLLITILARWLVEKFF
ncbi:MAG: hypothetical protein ACOYXT_01985 [Bacteroidota bacterium]